MFPSYSFEEYGHVFGTIAGHTAFKNDGFTDRAAVCGAIIDWADADEDMNACDPNTAAPTSRATEDISYQLLKKPYFRKNAAYDSLD